MNNGRIILSGEELLALPSGALWWPSARLLTVSDLHLGRSERMARQGGGLLPPYETRDTLDRLAAVIGDVAPETIVSLGDSFDDMGAAEAVLDDVLERLSSLAAGRRWIWIAGNHDPGPIELPGTNLALYRQGPLVFRHIAEPEATGEVSGHYHPKMRIRLAGLHISRPCFLADATRVILPAFGTYTGGMDATSEVFDRLLDRKATAWLTGRTVTPLPRDTETLINLVGAHRQGGAPR